MSSQIGPRRLAQRNHCGEDGHTESEQETKPPHWKGRSTFGVSDVRQERMLLASILAPPREASLLPVRSQTIGAVLRLYLGETLDDTFLA
jgi:hypothetical protein